MKVKVVKEHLGEGSFPTFKKGTKVTMKEECSHYLHWYACEIDGVQTYVPNTFVNDGVLTRDYNPTELVQKVDDILDVNEIVYAWIIATNNESITGWIPAEITVSIK